ncbi:hypothetical protein BD779DRAFT_1513660 [Infundibulicybe gibba]|nr:hypothetical protein BD779DRAFT_1513660 [Infundibulicybe gibba]
MTPVTIKCFPRVQCLFTRSTPAFLPSTLTATMPKTRNAVRLENLRPKQRVRDKDIDSSAIREKPQARLTRSTRTKLQEETPQNFPNIVRDSVNVDRHNKRVAPTASVLPPSSPPQMTSPKNHPTALATTSHGNFAPSTMDGDDIPDDPYVIDKENVAADQQDNKPSSIIPTVAYTDTPRLRTSQAPSMNARTTTLKRDGTGRRVRSKADTTSTGRFMGTLPTPPPRPRRKLPAPIRRPGRSINQAHSPRPQPPFVPPIASPKPLDNKTQERKRNRGIPSSLPPSSPPPPSSLRAPDAALQIATRLIPESESDDLPPSYLDAYVYDDDPDDLYLTEKENTRAPVTLDTPVGSDTSAARILAPNTSSDPFGFIAVEKRLKEQRMSRYREKQPHLQQWDTRVGEPSTRSSAHDHPQSDQELEYVDEPLIPPPTPHKRATRDTMYPSGIRSRSVSASRASTPSPSKPRRSTRVAGSDARAIGSGSQDESFELTEGATSLHVGKGKRKKSPIDVDDPTDDEAQPKRQRRGVATRGLKGKGKAKPAAKVVKKGAGKEAAKRKAKERVNPDLNEEQQDKWEQERQARLAYFKKLEGYVVEKENVYVI